MMEMSRVDRDDHLRERRGPIAGLGLRACQILRGRALVPAGGVGPGSVPERPLDLMSDESVTHLTRNGQATQISGRGPGRTPGPTRGRAAILLALVLRLLAS